jgi:hypothetical protein
MDSETVTITLETGQRPEPQALSALVVGRVAAQIEPEASEARSTGALDAVKPIEYPSHASSVCPAPSVKVGLLQAEL